MRLTFPILIAVVLFAFTFSVSAGHDEQVLRLPDPALDAPLNKISGQQTAVFAGGCFWGIQAVFQHVNGVISATSGYSGGDSISAHYEMVSGGLSGHAESVQVLYDPAKISFGQLLKVFFSVAHDPTQLNRQGPDTGPQYRSAIFTTSLEQNRIARAYVAQLDQAKVYGSRVTILAGQAAQKAAQDIKRQLAGYVAGVWGVSEEGIVFRAGLVCSKDDPNLSMPFRKLAQAACYSESGRVIMGRGYSQAEAEDYNFEEGSGNSDVNYSFVAQLTGVEVDLETGIVKATDFDLAFDAGRPLHLVNVESQIEGAAVQGLGQALYEEFKMDHGRTLNPDFVDYRMPLATEAPDIRIDHIITNDPDGIHGVKEASQAAIVCSPPSIVSAIHDATGIWFTSLPVTPEKLLHALNEKRQKENSSTTQGKA